MNNYRDPDTVPGSVETRRVVTPADVGGANTAPDCRPTGYSDVESASAGPAARERGGNQRRKTRQRQVILDELRADISHPTALEIHDLVRRRIPRLSLGTVYRNLDLLAQMGLIQKLEYSGGETRFDANLAQHDHLRCLQCGRIDDAAMPPLDLASPEDHDLRGYEILGHRLEFIGICPRCRQTSSTKQAAATGLSPGSVSTIPGESEHA